MSLLDVTGAAPARPRPAGRPQTIPVAGQETFDDVSAGVLGSLDRAAGDRRGEQARVADGPRGQRSRRRDEENAGLAAASAVVPRHLTAARREITALAVSADRPGPAAVEPTTPSDGPTVSAASRGPQQATAPVATTDPDAVGATSPSSATPIASEPGPLVPSDPSVALTMPTALDTACPAAEVPDTAVAAVDVAVPEAPAPVVPIGTPSMSVVSSDDALAPSAPSTAAGNVRTADPAVADAGADPVAVAEAASSGTVPTAPDGLPAQRPEHGPAAVDRSSSSVPTGTGSGPTVHDDRSSTGADDAAAEGASAPGPTSTDPAGTDATTHQGGVTDRRVTPEGQQGVTTPRSSPRSADPGPPSRHAATTALDVGRPADPIPLGLRHRMAMDVGGDGLGPLRLEATSVGRSVTVEFVSNDTSTVRLVAAHVHELVSDLRDAGMTAADVRVRTASVDAGANGRSGNAHVGGEARDDRRPDRPRTVDPTARTRHDEGLPASTRPRRSSSHGLDLLL